MRGVKAILLLAGSGKRFGDPLPKQFHLLHGKEIYLWTLHRLESSKLFEQIVLVCPEEAFTQVKGEVNSKHKVVVGGGTRQESSYRGLLACGYGTDIVTIHDAVRPFVSHRILEDNIAVAKRTGAVNTCIPSTDTLVFSPDGKEISHIPNRRDYQRGQTPQTFSYQLILKAHENTSSAMATDDCSLIIEQGGRVAIVQGDERNFKITTKDDLQIAELWFHQGEDGLRAY